MADLPSSAPVSSVSSSSGGGSGVSSGGGGSYQSAPANIANLPDNLQSISQNVTLGARFVSANPDGSVVLATAQGNLTVQSQLPIPANAQIQLQFQAGNPPTATLVLVNPSGSVSQTNFNMEQGVIQNTSNFEFNVLSQALSGIAPEAAPNLQAGSSVTALVVGNLQAAAGGNATQATTIALQASGLADALEEMASGNMSLNNKDISEQIKLLSQFGAPGPLPDQFGQLSLSGKLLTTVQQTLQQLQAQPGSTFGVAGNADALKTLLQFGQGADGSILSGNPGNLTPSQNLQTLLANLQSGENLLPGTSLILKLIDIIPPGQQVLGGNPALPGQTSPGTLLVPSGADVIPPGTQTLSGQISNQTLGNLPLLETSQGTLVLQAASKFPPGTTLVFELPAALPPAALAAQTAALDASKFNPAMPKLEQMLQLLSETDNQTFQVLMNNMPRMNGQLPASALFYLQALQTGDLRNWLGDKGIQALRRAGPPGMQLLGELEEEFKTIAGRADGAKPGEWRVMTIPYSGEYGIANMQFGVRNHFQNIDPDERRKQNLDENAGRVTRFIFDIQFSELGPMQIDGLLRPRTDYQKQLDVLLRTQHMLPVEMRQNLRDLFSESLGAYGMNGVLTFQAGHQNWISLTGRQTSHAASTRV